MSISSTDQFTRVRISRSSASILRLHAWVDGGGRYSWRFEPSGTSATDGELTDHDTLRDIYASADGLEDEDSNALVIDLRDFPSGISDETELEDWGYPNPLVEDSVTEWIDRKKVEGLFQQDAVVTEADSATGRKGMTLGADIGSTHRVPEGTNFNAPLDLWNLEPNGDDAFNLYLQVDPELEIDFTQNIPTEEKNELLRTIPGIRAMEAFVKANSSITADISLPLTDWGSRNLEWEIASGSTVQAQLTSGTIIIGVVQNSNSHCVGLRIPWTVNNASPVDYDEGLMQAYLDTETISTPIDGQPLEPTRTGATLSYLDGLRLYLGHRYSYLTRGRRGHLFDNYVDENFDMHHVSISGDFGESVHLDDISVATGDTYKRIPTRAYVNTVHATGTGDVDIQIATPGTFVMGKDKDRRIIFHSKKTSGVWNLRDWDENVFFTLQPNERAEFVMAQESGGAGEFTSLVVPERYLEYALQVNDIAAFNGPPRLDITSPNAGNARPLWAPSAVADYTVLHDDMFGIGSGAFSADTAVQAITSESDFYKAQAVKLLQGTTGFIDLNVFMRVQVTSGASGYIGTPQLRWFKFDGSTVSDLIDAEQEQDNIWGVNNFFSLRSSARAQLEKDDIILPTFYYADSQSLDVQYVKGRLLQIELAVRPQITLEYTP